MIAGNQWSYDVAQPPLVYDGKVGGHVHHVVSVATMEGVWFAFDANTGAPFYERVKVIDRVEHPALQPGKPVTVFPSSLGGLNYSPASFDPTTDYVFNAAAETAGVDIQAKLTPTQRKHKFVLGDVFLGLTNGNFGTELAGWHDHGSISAIDVNTGKRVWKFETPEPERGGVSDDCERPRLRRRRGRQPARIRLEDREAPLEVPDRPPDRGRADDLLRERHRVHRDHVGRDTDLIRRRHRLAAAGVQAGRFADRVAAPAPRPRVAIRSGSAGRRHRRQGAPVTARSSRAREARVSRPRVRCLSHVWSVDRSNTKVVSGRLLFGGKPVVGAAMQVDDYTVQNRTNANGQFSYRLDTTIPRRHIVRVLRLSGARVGGSRAHSRGAVGLLRVAGGFSVGYKVNELSARSSGGHVVVTGRLSYGDGSPVPPVVLQTYRLAGTITDAAGKPVAGATVVTRTQDRDFWTFSQPSDSSGHYVSFFTASDETGADPVPLTVQVAVGQHLVRVADQQERQLRVAAQRDDGRSAAGSGCAASPALGHVVRGRCLRGHARRRLRPGRRDQAALGDVAGRARPVHARAAGLRERQAAARVGGLLDVLPERERPSRWCDRHRHLARYPARVGQPQGLAVVVAH